MASLPIVPVAELNDAKPRPHRGGNPGASSPGRANRPDDGDTRESASSNASSRHEREALVKDAAVRGLTEERRNAVRQRVLAEIPWWYNPYAHLAATTGIGLVVLVASIFVIARLGLRWTDLLVIPAVVLIANFFEWRVHKTVLHRRFWPFEAVYDQHTPMHHMVYVEDDMALRSVQEFRLVLIPAAGVLGIVMATAPIAVAFAYLWSASSGWLFLLTTSLFMVSYEILHLCYHAPADSFIGQRKIIRVLRAHHARHHDPRLMQRYNFNVTVPLFDWIMGTMAPPQTETSAPSRFDGSRQY